MGTYNPEKNLSGCIGVLSGNRVARYGDLTDGRDKPRWDWSLACAVTLHRRDAAVKFFVHRIHNYIAEADFGGFHVRIARWTSTLLSSTYHMCLLISCGVWLTRCKAPQYSDIVRRGGPNVQNLPG